VPAAKPFVTQPADPVPLNGTAAQPLRVMPSTANPTVPVGVLPVTVAVKVTSAPTVDGFSELASVVVEDVGGVEPPPLNETASIKVVLSTETVPENVIVYVPDVGAVNITL